MLHIACNLDKVSLKPYIHVQIVQSYLCSFLNQLNLICENFLKIVFCFVNFQNLYPFTLALT